jgi:hypothetical protein
VKYEKGNFAATAGVNMTGGPGMKPNYGATVGLTVKF